MQNIKVGDRVRITQECNLYEGQEVEIMEEINDRGYIYFRCENEQHKGFRCLFLDRAQFTPSEKQN